MKTKLNAGIVGAGGYTGGEICRLLLNHPNINNIFPFSRGKELFEKAHPNLFGSTLEFINTNELINHVQNIDVLFFCAPSGKAMEMIPDIYDNNINHEKLQKE